MEEEELFTPVLIQSVYETWYPAVCMTDTLREGITPRGFENISLRTFGSKRDELTGEWRRLRNEELYDLYCPPNFIRVIKSRKMRWAGHVACGKTRDRPPGSPRLK
jgi:hypothetical protein